MPMDSNKALLVIQHQLKELDSIYQDTMEMSLNTVAGTERVAKWRVRTIALLTESVDEKAAQEFARLQPGMVFTNDLVEEFTDLVDCFRVPLRRWGSRSPAAQRLPTEGRRCQRRSPSKQTPRTAFLIDQNIVRKSSRSGAHQPTRCLKSVRPSILTDALSRTPVAWSRSRLMPRLCALLQARRPTGRMRVDLCGGRLIHPFETLPAGVVVANLPYYISTRSSSNSSTNVPVPALGADAANEVADRLVAKASDDDYGVLLGLRCSSGRREKAFKVSASCSGRDGRRLRRRGAASDRRRCSLSA